MASYTSSLRLTGLSSGVDTDSYVKQLMYSESTRYYNYQRKVQKIQWKQEKYRSVISDIQDFQSKWLDLTSSSSLRLQKTFNNKYKSSATLANGSETKNVTISDVKGTASHTIEVLDKASTARIDSSASSIKTSDNLSTLVGDNFPAVISINDKSIEIEKDMSVKDFMDTVNKSDAGVKMTYNSVVGAFSIETTDTGSKSKININDSNGIFSALGFSGDGVNGTAVSGTNARVKVDGFEIEANLDSNIIKFDEFSVDIKNASKGDSIIVSAEKDTEAIYSMVNEFVEAYNKLIGDIGTTTKEQRSEGVNGYYEPLTDDEKKEMDESDIEKWETEAKKGLLYRDDYLEGFLSKVRSAFYSNTAENSQGKKVGIYNYGITTTSDTSQGGKLVIDEEKLKKAISEEPEAITSLLNGISEELNTVVNKYTGSNGLLTVKAGIEGKPSEFDNYMKTEIDGIKDKMTLELQRLQDKESRYYELFASMETNISDNNTMLDTLYGYFS